MRSAASAASERRGSTGVAWIETLSPWPTGGFGLERMHALLDALGHPERAYPAVHVVGTNGKSTAARTVEALLLDAGLSVGTYLSPHVRSWSERIRVDGEEADLEAALARVHAAAVEVGATQFEVLTAAALAAFAERDVHAAVVEAGLGGRLDATNVLGARVVLLTNVAREHTDVLGETREEIAREKLAVAHAESVVVLPDDEFAPLVPGRRVVVGGAREAAAAFLGRPVAAAPPVVLPGRLEWRGDRELWDGAHNPHGAEWLVAQLPPADWVVCASVARDKDVDAVLATLARAGSTLVATASSSPRALPARELATRAGRVFARVEAVEAPHAALARARALAEPGRPVLVTGSLYLLADLSRTAPQ